MLIIISMMAPPAMGYQFSNGGQHVLPALHILYIKSDGPGIPVPDTSNLTSVEQKIEPNLRNLVMSQKTFGVEKNADVARLMNTPELYKRGNISLISGNAIQTSPDIVYVDITISPGNSSHILDPYLYQLNSRGILGNGLSAWVDVSKIIEIANLSAVTSIRIVTPAFYEAGMYETQDNST